MPIYEYQCPQCHAVFEEWLTVRDAGEKNTAPCPHCETVSPHIISNTAFVLKGGGWYVTEYGNRKNSTQDSGQAAAQNAEQASEKGAQSDTTKASEKESASSSSTCDNTSTGTSAKSDNAKTPSSGGSSTQAASQGAPLSSTKNTATTNAAAS